MPDPLSPFVRYDSGMAKPRFDFDLTTPCTLCGYKIPPNELMRTGWYTLKCPKCEKEFSLPEPPKGCSTS